MSTVSVATMNGDTSSRHAVTNEIVVGTEEDDGFDLRPDIQSDRIDGRGGSDSVLIEAWGTGIGTLSIKTRSDGVTVVTDSEAGTRTTIVNVEKIVVAEAWGLTAHFGDGDDEIYYPFGTNHLYGGGGDDIIDMDDAANEYSIINGGDGNDRLIAGQAYNTVIGGAGDDWIQSGRSDDWYFKAANIHAGPGDDRIESMGLDTVDGGSGNDLFVFDQHNLDIPLVFDVASINSVTDMVGFTSTVDGEVYYQESVVHVETFDITGGIKDDVFRTRAGDDRLSGSRGNDVLDGRAGNDVLDGGADNDSLTGGAGADVLSGGAGADRFVWRSAAESNGRHADTVTDFDALADNLVLPFAVTRIDATVYTALNTATLDRDLAAGASTLGRHHAMFVGANGGDEKGDFFLIVDANGTAGYQAGSDLVVRFTGQSHMGHFSLSNFAAGDS